MSRIPGHLALWPALYTIGVLLLTGKLMNATVPHWAGICFVGFCAHGCYLLDRVKIADSRLDSADLIAQPKRYAFLHRHTTSVRMLIVVDLILAVSAGVVVNPLLIWIPPAALLGVHIYAGRSAAVSRPRPKDIPALKAFFIAGAHLALAASVLIGELGIMSIDLSGSSLAILLAVGAVVFGDALLCDLDDLDSDRQFQTKSIPVLVGRDNAWILAVGAHAVGLCILLIGVGWTPAIGILGGGLLLTDALLTMLSKQRDAVDARLVLLAILYIVLSG